VKESNVFSALGLALSEKHISQITENTEKTKWWMELLESDGPRPRERSALPNLALRVTARTKKHQPPHCKPVSGAARYRHLAPIRKFRAHDRLTLHNRVTEGLLTIRPEQLRKTSVCLRI
jgi:hypothetical protein